MATVLISHLLGQKKPLIVRAAVNLLILFTRRLDFGGVCLAKCLTSLLRGRQVEAERLKARREIGGAGKNNIRLDVLGFGLSLP